MTRTQYCLSFFSLLLSISVLHAETLKVVDRGIESNFQQPLGEFQRGRALVAADFDLDGRVDLFVGNPDDRSFILRNVGQPGEQAKFEVSQILTDGDLSWGAVAADFDNDGDYDLFITKGGNEGPGFDQMFRNLWIESGKLAFEDVTDQAGIAVPVPEGFKAPIIVASANAVAGDYDRDGDIDLFVSVAIHKHLSLPELKGRNILWRNDGNWHFTDVTDAVGLSSSAADTRHSTFLDIDNDGDIDLYENNMKGRNLLWQNRLAETGSATFKDVTAEFSSLRGEDMGYPINSFVSCAADFNNDGWEDIIAFKRHERGEKHSPYPPGHHLFLNQNGIAFRNISSDAGLTRPAPFRNGVMGSQVGDLNNDGTPDIFVGNGGPTSGLTDNLYISSSRIGEPLTFVDHTALIDFPAVELANAEPNSYPPYPYRTHGAVIADLDNDGLNELAVVNGGMRGRGGTTGRGGDDVSEPNRFFEFEPEFKTNVFKVRAVGDGQTVSRDAIGTRFALTVSKKVTKPWTIHRTLYAGSCFSAQNGFEIAFGLADADRIHSLRVIWPDGATDTINDNLSLGGSLVVKYKTSITTNPPANILAIKTIRNIP